VIPIAVIGAEETMPVVTTVPALAKLLGLPYFPVTANMFLLGPLGAVLPFPSKFRLRVLDPVVFDAPSGQDRYPRSRLMEEAERIRVGLQDTIYEMLRERRSVWSG
jgi:hypothetical protein